MSLVYMPVFHIPVHMDTPVISGNMSVTHGHFEAGATVSTPFHSGPISVTPYISTLVTGGHASLDGGVSVIIKY